MQMKVDKQSKHILSTNLQTAQLILKVDFITCLEQFKSIYRNLNLQILYMYIMHQHVTNFVTKNFFNTMYQHSILIHIYIIKHFVYQKMHVHVL